MAALKVLHEVTACIYKGEEKPVMKWSFLTKVENKDLKSFLQALNAFGVDQRAKELGIQAPVPEKTISANRGLNPANQGIKFVLRLDCVPQNTISTIPGIK